MISNFLPPNFSQDLPPEFNLGKVGWSIAHEFIHGFTIYDLGISARSQWLNKSLEHNLLEQRKTCMVEQHSMYQVFNDTRLNGTLTLNENIADNGALHIAYNALQKLYKDNNTSPEQPTKMRTTPAALTKFTPNQLFFLSYAQQWCHNITERDLRKIVKTDTHSPKRYRVLGPLQNFSPFSKAFSCKAGSPMNPNRKCQVW
jgi:predicted metalloendopeptidase